MALNEKQEKFAQAYVLHRNATEAAKAAGYSDKSAYNQGYRLLQIDEVVERVHTLENELETNVNVLEEIEKQYSYAATNGHTNSAIKALELLGRVRGANSDTKVPRDREALETAIIKCLNVLGQEKLIDLLSKTDYADLFFEAEDLEENAAEDEAGEPLESVGQAT